jgi:hypothetical protein
MERDYVKQIVIKEDFVSKYNEILENAKYVCKMGCASIDLLDNCTLVSQRISNYNVYIASTDKYNIKSFLGKLERLGIEFEVKE